MDRLTYRRQKKYREKIMANPENCRKEAERVRKYRKRKKEESLKAKEAAKIPTLEERRIRNTASVRLHRERNRLDPEWRKKQADKVRRYRERKLASRRKLASQINLDSEPGPSFIVDDTPDHLPITPPLSEIPTSTPEEAFQHECDIPWRTARRQLNKKQASFLSHFRHVIQQKIVRILLQGSAGTGKSFLISRVETSAIQLFGPDCVMKSAMTGKAAHNIGGHTLHFALKLYSDYDTPLSEDKLQKLKKRFASVRLLIIDEVSMLGQSFFHKVDRRLRKIKQCNELFGGLHVLLFGDFKQLHPVRDKSLSLPDEDNLLDHFEFFELMENMRQKEDPRFFQLLSNLSENALTDEDVEILKTRVVNEPPSEAIQLYFTNKEVDEANQKKLSSFISCPAIDKIKTPVSEALKKDLQCDIKKLPHDLHLSKGSRYMVTRNLDVDKGIVNGFVGILEDVEYAKDFRYIKNIVLKSPQQIVKLHRVTTSFKRHGITITRKQFPCRVAEAITVHASQGSTLDPICVGRLTNSNMMYVAFSRCRTLDGLYILNEFKFPRCKDSISQWLTCKRTASLVPHFQFLCTPGLQIMYHNVQSLDEHHSDIQWDPYFLSSDIILLSETCTIVGDRFKFQGFYEICQIPSDTSIRKPSGVSIYVKNLNLQSELFPNYEKDIHVCAVRIETKVIAVLFAKPESAVEDIVQQIDKVRPTILAGNFNMTLERELQDALFMKYGLEMRSTVDGKAIFSTQPLLNCGVYDNGFNEHFPMYARL